MKKISIFFLALIAFIEFAEAKYVKPYYRKDGTLVQGSMKTISNKSKLDNYSSQGMINPYSNQKGYKNPYKPQRYKRKK